MKCILTILLLVSVFSSCKQQKSNELNETEFISEEKESYSIDSVKPVSQKDTIDTLNNHKLIADKIKLTLPTPDTAFLIIPLPQ